MLAESFPKIMGFAAEIFSSVVVAELVNRCMSFLFNTKFENKQAMATVQEDLQLLRRLLMRGNTIVEEAERRHVANLDMLRQLSTLRDTASSTPSGAEPFQEEEEEEGATATRRKKR